MDSQTFFREKLAHRFAELKSRNPQYSLRAFARDIDQNPAAISQILRAKRRVSKSFALSVVEKMGLSPKDYEALVHLFETENPKRSLTIKVGTVEENRTPLSIDTYDLVADWIYFAILSLAETKEFRSDYTWIANRLSISPKQTDMAIRRLVDLGYMTEDSSGCWHLTGINLCTTDGIANVALRKRHELNLEDARKSLYRDSVFERDFSFITMAVDASRLPVARKMIRDFQNKLCDFLQGGEKNEVYEICTQLFPRTKTLNHNSLNNQDKH